MAKKPIGTEGLKEILDYNKGFQGAANFDQLADQMRLMVEKNVDVLGELHDKGKLTAKGYEKLEKQIEKTRVKGFSKLDKELQQNFLKTQEKASKQIDGFTNALSDSIKNVTSFIPVLGKAISKGFDKIMPGIQKVLTAGMMRVFGAKASSVLSSLTKFGGAAAGLIGLVKWVGGAVNQVDAMMASISKSTGFLRKDIRPITEGMDKYQESLLSAGISLKDQGEALSALATEFGQINRVTSGMVNTASMWSKVFGMGVDAVAKSMDVLHRIVGLSEQGMNDFVANLGGNARIAGVSLSMVMRDIANDSNFIALYSDKYGNNIKHAAIESRKMGSNLSEAAGIANTFLDYETAIGNTMELNLIAGTNFNAMQLHGLAVQGDLVGLQKTLAVGLEKNIKWEDMNVLQRQKIAQSMGTSVEHAKKLIMWARLGPGEYDKAVKAYSLLQEQSANMQTIWEKIHNIFAVALGPAAIKIGKAIEAFITPKLNKVVDIITGKNLGPKEAAGLGAAIEFIGNEIAPTAKEVGRIIGAALVDGMIVAVKSWWESDYFKAIAIGAGTGAVVGGSAGLGIGAIPGAVIGGAVAAAGYDAAVGDETSQKARGGIVTKPTRAIIGEAGPELILPLGGGMPQMKGGALQFARGGSIIPLGGSAGGLAGAIAGGTGSMNAAGDPFERRLRVQAVKDAAEAYRASMRDEDRRVMKEQQDQNKEFGRSVRSFGGGVGGFIRGVGSWASNIGNVLKQITGMGYQDMANHFLGPKWGGRAGQVVGGIQAYRTGGWGGLADQVTGEGGIFGEGGMGHGLFGGQAGDWAAGYQEGGIGGLGRAWAGSEMGTKLATRVSNLFGGLDNEDGSMNMIGNAIFSGMTGDSEGMRAFLGETSVGKFFTGEGMGGMIGKGMGHLGGLGGGAMKLLQGDFKGAGKAVLKGTASKALYAIPGVGQFIQIGDMLGLDISGKAMDVGKSMAKGIGQAGKGVGQIFKGDFKAGFKNVGKGLFKATGVSAVAGMLGYGKGAKIESAWHPGLLQYLYSKGMKPGDKIPKDEIKSINKQIFGNEKAPGTKDGFSFYDMKGDEEKADRQRSPTQSLAKSQEIAASFGTSMDAVTGTASGPAPRKMGGFGQELGNKLLNAADTAMQSSYGKSMLGQVGIDTTGMTARGLWSGGQDLVAGSGQGNAQIISLLTQIASNQGNVYLDGRNVTDLVGQNNAEKAETGT